MKKLRDIKKLLCRPKNQDVGFLAVLLLGAVLLLLAQAVYGWVNPSNRSSSDNDRLVMMMTSAIYDVSKPAVVEPHSKQVFLPDANIVLPAYPDHQMEVRYSYGGEADGQQSMQITTSQAVQSGIAKVLGAQPSNDTKALFAEVPNAQACARGLAVTFDGSIQSPDGASLAFSKKLQDGRHMNVYEQNSCEGYDFVPLISYLKDAKSY